MKTFSQSCLKAISHLSKNMQNRIIGDVTRFMLTGEIPEKLPPMRKALFISLILQLDPEADLEALEAPDVPKDVNDVKDLNDLNDLNDVNDLKDPAPSSSSSAATVTPVEFPAFSILSMSSAKPTRAERRRFMRAFL